MKKKFVTLTMLFCVLFFNTLSAQSKQSTYEALASDSIGTHPKTQDTHVGKLAHWSLFLQGGISLFDGDFSQKYDLLPKTGIKPTVGIGLEYSISPIWGVGVEYAWNRFGVSDGDVTLKSDVHSADIFVNADMMDVFMPHRKKEIFSLYLGIGVGVAFYNSHLDRGDGNGDVTNDDNRNYVTSATFPLSVLAEWNIGRHIGLGIKGQYRFFNKDNLDTKRQGTKSDIIEDVTVQLRYKFAAKKKDHVRNLIPKYEEKMVADELLRLKERTDQLDRALAAMQPEVQRLTEYAFGPDSDKDGVPDYRDLEANTPGNSILVDFWGRAITCCDQQGNIVQNTTPQQDGESQLTDAQRNFRFIYFDLDSYVLNEESKLIIAQVAEYLQHKPEAKVEIRAYCDGVGSTEYNQKLAKMRAAVVKEQLNTVFGIENNRMILNPFGRVGEANKIFAPNRRVEFHFDK